MWRKPEESKATSPSPEPRETPQGAPSAPTPAYSPVTAAPVREAALPTSQLTSSLVIKGEITGREDLFIDGEVHGTIHLDEGKITIGPNGRATADVEANEIIVRGYVKGDLHGLERVQVKQTGHALGDVLTKRILVEEGAELHGHVEIVREAERQQPQVKKVTTPAVESRSTAAVPAANPQEHVTIA